MKEVNKKENSISHKKKKKGANLKEHFQSLTGI